MYHVERGADDVMEAVEVALCVREAQDDIDGTFLNSSYDLVREGAIVDKLLELVENVSAEASEFRLVNLEAVLLVFSAPLHLRVGEDLLLIYEVPADALRVRVRNLEQLGGLQDGQSELYLGNKKLYALLLRNADICIAPALVIVLLLDHLLTYAAGFAGEGDLILAFLGV